MRKYSGAWTFHRPVKLCGLFKSHKCTELTKSSCRWLPLMVGQAFWLLRLLCLAALVVSASTATAVPAAPKVAPAAQSTFTNQTAAGIQAADAVSTTPTELAGSGPPAQAISAALKGQTSFLANTASIESAQVLQ